MSENNKKESDFWGEKASFVSAVVFLIAAFNSVWDIKNDIRCFVVVVVVEILVVEVLIYAILVKKWLDKKLDSKKARNFSTYITVCSVIIFVLELIVQIRPNDNLIVYIISILLILVGSLYLLFGKY